MIKEISFIEHFLARPSMYIGEKSLEKLAIFVGGARVAEDMHKIPKEKRLFNPDFENWVEKKTKTRSAGRSYQIALNKSKNNADEAFNLWIEWYTLFLKEQNHGT